MGILNVYIFPCLIQCQTMISGLRLFTHDDDSVWELRSYVTKFGCSSLSHTTVKISWIERWTSEMASEEGKYVCFDATQPKPIRYQKYVLCIKLHNINDSNLLFGIHCAYLQFSTSFLRLRFRFPHLMIASDDSQSTAATNNEHIVRHWPCNCFFPLQLISSPRGVFLCRRK